MNIYELIALIDDWERDMTLERALNVMYNERRSAVVRLNGTDNEIIRAYDFVINKLNELKEKNINEIE